MDALIIISQLVANLLLLRSMIKVTKLNHTKIKESIAYEKECNKVIEKKRKLNHARPLIWRG